MDLSRAKQQAVFSMNSLLAMQMYDMLFSSLIRKLELLKFMNFFFLFLGVKIFKNLAKQESRWIFLIDWELDIRHEDLYCVAFLEN